MRLLMATLLAAGAGTAALAEDPSPLRAFPDAFFSVDFTKEPAVSQGTFPAVTPIGTVVAVPATTYTQSEPGATFRVTVARLADTPAHDGHALDHAVAAFRRLHPALPLDTVISQSLNGSKAQLCGRNFGFAGADGSLHYETFYYNPHTALFYDVGATVEAKAQAQHGGDAEHFETSFSLTADPASQLPAPPPWPDNWKPFHDPDGGFDIRFPAPPTVEQGSYITDVGITVPATRFWAKAGGTLYRLTVARPWGTAADPEGTTAEASVLGAVRQWDKQGTVIADDDVAISAGQCGHDITLRKPDGLGARASIYFPATQQKIYIIEVTQTDAATPVDPLDDRRFRESLTLALAQ